MSDDALYIEFDDMYAFDMVDGDKTVGTIDVSVHKQKTSIKVVFQLSIALVGFGMFNGL